MNSLTEGISSDTLFLDCSNCEIIQLSTPLRNLMNQVSWDAYGIWRNVRCFCGAPTYCRLRDLRSVWSISKCLTTWMLDYDRGNIVTWTYSYSIAPYVFCGGGASGCSSTCVSMSTPSWKVSGLVEKSPSSARSSNWARCYITILSHLIIEKGYLKTHGKRP